MSIRLSWLGPGGNDRGSARTDIVYRIGGNTRHPGHRDEAAATVLLEDVSRRYELGGVSVTALAGLDLEVDEGEFVVVLGPSGSGKTAALDEATSGTMTVAGRRISGARRKDLFKFRRHTVSFIFQSFNLFPGLTAAENVRFGADVAGADADIDRILADVGLGERRDHFAHDFRRRTAAGRDRACARHPEPDPAWPRGLPPTCLTSA